MDLQRLKPCPVYPVDVSKMNRTMVNLGYPPSLFEVVWSGYIIYIHSINIVYSIYTTRIPKDQSIKQSVQVLHRNLQQCFKVMTLPAVPPRSSTNIRMRPTDWEILVKTGAKYLAFNMGDLKKYQWGSFRHSHTSAGFGDLMTYKLNVPVAGLTNNAQEFVVHVECRIYIIYI